MLSRIKSNILNAILAKRLRSVSRDGMLEDDKLLIKNSEVPNLTKAELADVTRYWGDIAGPKIKMGLNYYKVCKKLRCFDVRYVPSSYYVPNICYVLNPRNYIPYFVNKSLQDMHFQDINRPETVVKSIGGIFYTPDNHQISIKDCISLICNETDELILKKSTNTSGGKGIVFIQDKSSKKIKELLSDYEDDIIIQRVLKPL